MIGEPLRPVLGERARAAIGKKAQPGQSQVDRLMARVAGTAAFVVQPSGDEVVHFDRKQVPAHRLGKTSPDQKADHLPCGVRGGFPEVREHGLGGLRAGRVDGQQLKACLLLGTQPVQ